MSTQVQYGEIILGNVLTKLFEQRPIRDHSDTDRIGSQYLVVVESLVSVSAAAKMLGVSGVLVPGTSATDIYRGVREALSTERLTFVYSIDGVELLRAGPNNDLNNGPKPKMLRISHVTGETLRIEWGIDIVTADCHNSQAIPVVSNRWSSSDDIDEHFRTTRTWKGKLRMGTSKGGTISPHQFRHLCVPTLQLGFRRTRMNFIASEDGLELGYEVCDQQMLGDAPPVPASKWSFTHTENLRFDGHKNEGTLSIRLYGTPRANKQDLIAFGIALIEKKLLAKNLNVYKGKSIITDMAIVEHGGDSEHSVDIRCNVIRTPSASTSTPGIEFGSLILATIGRRIKDFNIPNYNQDQAIVFGPRGTNDPALLAGIFGCFLQSPCSANHAMPQGGPAAGKPTSKADKPKQGYDKPPEASASVGQVPDLPSPGESDEHKKNMYIHARLESRLEVDGGYRGLPIAKGKNSTTKETTKFVKLFPEQAIRVIRYEAERLEAWPVLWKPKKFKDEAGIEYRLKSWKPIFQARSQTGDGQVLHTIDAEYTYLMSRPPSDGEKIATIVLPWDLFTPSDNAFPGDKMIEPGDSQQGFI